MPTPQEILAGLTTIANQWIALAIAWHVLIALALAGIALGWRPTLRTGGVLVSALPASAALAALAHGNPFNGLVLSATAAALAILAARARGPFIHGARRWSTVAGLAMIAFGSVYPHFLGAVGVAYLYAAPVGVVPCPSLSVAIGFALFSRGAGRAWTLTLAAVGGFYAVFGAVRLGVTLDLGLLVGAALLATTAMRPRSSA